MSLKKPFTFGKIQLPSNIFCAPLAGCSDVAFREIACNYRPGLVFCEMVKTDALVRHDSRTYKYLAYSSRMHPIGAQLCGSDPAIAATAAKIVEDLGFDVIDLNCGCPVDKVTKDGSGSGLLRNPEKIGDMLAAITAVVKIPVTLKIRTGWDSNQINATKIVHIAEQAGATAITVHGRTREQGYKGAANWNHIRDCKLASRTILVIGNGDIFDPYSADQLFKHTGCDGVLVARGTLGQPWIFEDIERYLTGLEPHKRSVDDIKNILIEHFYKICGSQPEYYALLDMRRVGCWYLKSCHGAKPLRIQLNQASCVKQVFQILESFDWQSVAPPTFVERNTEANTPFA